MTLDDLERRNSSNRRVISPNSVAFCVGHLKVVPKSVTLNDLKRRNGCYIALFHWIW